MCHSHKSSTLASHPVPINYGLWCCPKCLHPSLQHQHHRVAAAHSLQELPHWTSFPAAWGRKQKKVCPTIEAVTNFLLPWLCKQRSPRKLCMAEGFAYTAPWWTIKRTSCPAGKKKKNQDVVRALNFSFHLRDLAWPSCPWLGVCCFRHSKVLQTLYQMFFPPSLPALASVTCTHISLKL